MDGKVSFFKHLGEHFDKVENKTKPNNPARGYNGLEIKPLTEVLKYTLTLDPKKPKHFDGGMFSYQSNVCGKYDPSKPEPCECNKDMVNDIIFIDIDHISRKDADTIFNSFEEMTAVYHALHSIQYSSSYYVGSNPDDVGMHLFVLTTPKKAAEIEYDIRLAAGMVKQTIKKVCGLDVELDENVLNPYHRAFIHYGEYKVNQYAAPANIPQVLKDKIVDEFKDLFKKFDVKTEQKRIEGNGSTNYEESKYNVIQLFDPATINCVPKYYPHNKRWPIFQALYYCNKDLNWIKAAAAKICLKEHGHGVSFNEQEWNNEIITHINATPIAVGALDAWLKRLSKIGLIAIEEKRKDPAPVQTNPNYACIDMDEMMGVPETLFDERSSKYLSSYVREIDSYIQNENILSIIAPTGSGKTSCLSGIVNRKRTGEGLVDLYPNSYIIVPMNVTNELYKGLNIVSSNSNNKIIYGKPNVMIWDQFNKNFDTIKKHRPDIVFVDESHTLYLDRSYRDSAIKCIEKLRLLQDLGTKIVFISATPAGEVNMFNAFVLEFKRKDTRHVKFQLCYTEDTLNAIMDDVKAEEFDKICIFSDYDSRLAYAYCVKDNKDATIYHSEWKSNVDQLRKDEKVISPVSFFTCLAFNGLNIRNTGEKILIDIRLTPGETTYNEIIQIIGRFRFNDDITVRLYVDNKYSSKVDLQEAFNDAKVIIDSDSEEVITPYWERMNDKDVQDALTSIKEYCDKFSLSYIVSLIKNDGYQIKAYKVSGAGKLKKRNPLKDEASDLYKALRMKNIDMIDRENTDKEVLKFIDHWEHEINAMRYSYNDKVLEVLDSMISKDGKKTSVLMGTLIDRLKNILKIWNMTDQEWIEMVSKRVVLLAAPGLSQKTKDDLRKKVFDVNDRLRLKYKDMDFNNLTTSIIDEQDAFFDLYSESQSEKGKKGDKIKKGEAGKKGKRIIYNGVEYSTCKECAAAIGKSTNTVTDWIKKGKIITT